MLPSERLAELRRLLADALEAVEAESPDPRALADAVGALLPVAVDVAEQAETASYGPPARRWVLAER